MKRVLWVEDDKRICKTVDRLCRASGVEVTIASCARSAIALLPPDAVDVPLYLAVISDFDLGPGPNGQDVLAAAERAGIPIRILCSSGSHDSTDCPAATVIYDKTFMREMVETVLAPMFKVTP